jgi:hypothetical protein
MWSPKRRQRETVPRLRELSSTCTGGAAGPPQLSSAPKQSSLQSKRELGEGRGGHGESLGSCRFRDAEFT